MFNFVKDDMNRNNIVDYFTVDYFTVYKFVITLMKTD